MSQNKNISTYKLIFLSSIVIAILTSSCKKDNVDIVENNDTNSSSIEYGSFIDNRDGKEYKTINIGNQIWMAENLAFKIDTGGCWAYNNDNSVAVYGYLYNWWTANIAVPSGWHLPTEIEWSELIMYIGGDSIAGVKMKESGYVHWKEPNNATNSSGFTALPSGFRTEGAGICIAMSYSAYWWCSTEYAYDNNGAFAYSLYYLDSNISKGINYNKLSGYSVRCVKD